eukprot:1154514-Pelagomonas_calceolata.AAC.3
MHDFENPCPSRLDSTMCPPLASIMSLPCRIRAQAAWAASRTQCHTDYVIALQDLLRKLSNWIHAQAAWTKSVTTAMLITLLSCRVQAQAAWAAAAAAAWPRGSRWQCAAAWQLRHAPALLRVCCVCGTAQEA